MREEEKRLSETAKNITIYYGYEFRTYTGNIYDKNEFFYAQYCQAARCISEIVNESEIFCEKYRNGRSEYDQESNRAERQELRGYPNNIVAFCSRRGNGKTSAMLSMTRALEMLPLKDETEEKYEFWRKARDTPRKFYDNNHENFERKAKKQVEDCNYLVMETIDPANMEQNDSILLNILSRMYHMWDQDFKQEKSRDEYISRDLVNAFQDAYRNVYSLKKPLEGDDLDEYDSLTRLSEKGDSVNTKHAFRKLVEYFLQYFKKNMLVIPVDDADLNTTRAYEIVEDLRKYCVGPRILVILALHLDTLRNCIEQENVKRYRYLLSNQMNIPHLPGNKCREMAERYIDKLIPGYHQIHLPYVDEWFRTGRSDINLFYYSSGKREKTDLLRHSETSGYNYQHRLFRLVYEKTGIILMPAKHYLHNFLPRRYRELSHFLSYFCDMKDIDVSGEGSLKSLMRTCYGGQEESEETEKRHRELLALRKENLENMMIYFLQYWCPISLEKDQLKILQEIAAVPLKMKCQRTIDLLYEYCNKLERKRDDTDIGFYLRGTIEFPDESEPATYVQVMNLLDQLKNQLNVEQKFEFNYLILKNH